MSIFTALRDAYSFEDAFQAKDCTSQAMREAIGTWFRLYYEQEATEEFDPCQRIAYTIVNKLTKTAFGEYAAAGGDGFLQAVLDALDAVKKAAMQQALIGGEAWLMSTPTRKCRFSPKWNVIFRRLAQRCIQPLYTTSLAGLKPVKP